MRHVIEAEKKLGRPIGGLMGRLKREDGTIWESYIVPAHDGKARDMIFIRKPSLVERAISYVRGK